MFAKLQICAGCYIYLKKHGISHIIYKELPYYGGGLAIEVLYHTPTITPTPTAPVETVYFFIKHKSQHKTTISDRVLMHSISLCLL